MTPHQAPSLVKKLSWLLAIQTLIGLGVVSVSIYVAMSLILAARETEELRAKAELLRHVVREAPGGKDTPALRHKLDDILTGHGDLEVVVVDAGGQTVYRNVPASDFSRSRQTELQTTWLRSVVEEPVHLRIKLDTSDNQAVLQGLAATLLAATIIGAAAVSFGGFWQVRQALMPLRRLARETRELEAHRLDQRLGTEGYARELQPWIRQFNLLLSRLEGAYQQLEGFNADVAHELRTPLATLVTRTELDLQADRSAAELRDSMGASLEDLHRLSSIVNDMLFLSRADRGIKARRGDAASVAEEVVRVLEFHEAAIEESELTVGVHGDARLAFDAGLLRRAISNLVENATRYAHASSEISVDIATEKADEVSIKVHNIGTPVDPKILPRLLDRFYREESARSRTAGKDHYGLGLAIVAAIARMHDGKTFATSDGGHTTIGFTVKAQSANEQKSDLTGSSRQVQ